MNGDNPDVVLQAPAKAGSAAPDATTAGESLSQLLARILDQLSLSAWLPSALLVMTLFPVVQLRVAGGDVGETLTALRSIGWVDALYLFVAVIVLTVVTQAMEFGAIRILEGYWSPSRPVERVADIFCRRQSKRRDRFATRHAAVQLRAFERARSALKQDAAAKRARELPVVVSDRDLEIIEARLLDLNLELTEEEVASARNVPWMDHAPLELRRRVENLAARVKQYPDGNRVLPTRLGNILRSYEEVAFGDMTGALEDAVRRLFHLLPEHIQSEHDHHRNRLNLYCSLVVVALAVGVLSVALLWALGWIFAAVAGSAAVLAARRAYRAAIASAHAYGGMLPLIADHQS